MDDDDNVLLEFPRAVKHSRMSDYSDSENVNNGKVGENIGSKEDSAKEQAQIEDDGEEASACPICFEPWTSSGKHRIVSLKCGHLFGRMCIEKWLNHSVANNKCPQCNASARKSDLRVLFVAKKIVAVDDDGREEQLLRQLEDEKKNKRIALDREASLAQQIQLLRAENIRLKEEIAQYKLEKLLATSCDHRFTYIKQITLANSHLEECRNIYSDEHYRMAIVSRSHESSHNLIRISLDSNGYSVLPDTVHSKAIKGISGSFFKDGLIASVGLDCRLKLSSLQSGTLIAEWGLAAPGWSVTFDRLDRNILFVGLGNRRISVIDVRQTQLSVKEAILIDTGCPPLPVHSLQMIQFASNRYLIGATMNGVFLSEPYSNFSSLCSPIIKTVNFKDALGLCSGFTCTSDGLYFLAIFRQVDQSTQILLFTLEDSDSVISNGVDSVLSFRIVAKFSASNSTRLINPCLFYSNSNNNEENRQGKLTAAIIDEPSSTIHLWEIDVINGFCRLKDTLTPNTARPLYSITHSSQFIQCVSDQQLFLYK